MKKSLLFLLMSLLCCSLLLHAQTERLLGDVDANGTVNIVDALIVAQFIVSLDPLPWDAWTYDVDCNSKIDIIDALIIAQYYVGMRDSLPGCTTRAYPTTLKRLSDARIATLQAEFEALNNNTVFGTIGPYGLLTCYSIPYGQAPTGNPLTDEAEVLTLAREALIKNTKFTNVTSSTRLDNYRVIHASATSNWTVEFHFDYYDYNQNIPQLFSTISVEVNREVYCIEYHVYPAMIKLPAAKVAPAEAMTAVLGEVLIYYDFAGQPQEYTVTEESLTIPPSMKWIIPRETSEGMEYHYCWQVDIAEGMWNIYVDVVTGEIIHVKQNFVT